METRVLEVWLKEVEGGNSLFCGGTDKRECVWDNQGCVARFSGGVTEYFERGAKGAGVSVGAQAGGVYEAQVLTNECVESASVAETSFNCRQNIATDFRISRKDDDVTPPPLSENGFDCLAVITK